MSTPRFLQIHTLTPYAAALLNRDDVGRAKRLPFGGKERVRVSSQCLKRHWRTAPGIWSLDGLDEARTVRSRRIFTDRIADPLVAEGHPLPLVVATVAALRDLYLEKSDRAAAAEGKKGAPTDEAALRKSLETGQVTVIGEPEIDHLLSEARRVLADDRPGDAKAAAAAVAARFKEREAKENLRTMRLFAGLDAALFGRMITSDILARTDAAVHVAHSFTVHAEESEPEYFTAVDDLVRESGETGSGLIGNTELTSGLFYGYVVVDLPLLVANLSGDPVLAAEAVRRLVGLIATVSPGAKLGSTAPYAYADLVLVEAGDRQPRTLANAFLKPVPTRTDVRADAVAAMSAYLARVDGMYGTGETRRVASLVDLPDGFPSDPAKGLDDLARFAAETVGAAVPLAA
jgi:CRISPR system Cascade subunit CasC